jgi:hypothetical protein
MNSVAIRAVIICVFGAAAIAGCASQPSSPSVASAQKGVHSGKVAAVENTAVVDQAVVGNSSGSSTVVTAASGGPSLVTVRFNDGEQGRYVLEHPTATYRVGQPVYVITDGDRITIMPQ